MISRFLDIEEKEVLIKICSKSLISTKLLLQEAVNKENRKNFLQ